MIVARPHQEGEIKCVIRSGGAIKARLNLDTNTILVNKLEPYIGTAGEIYDGDYIVKPLPFDSQTLETKYKTLTENVVVLEIPYFETTNLSNGLTVYIGE